METDLNTGLGTDKQIQQQQKNAVRKSSPRRWFWVRTETVPVIQEAKKTPDGFFFFFGCLFLCV